MMLKLNAGAMRMAGAPEIINSKGKVTQPQQNQLGAFKVLALRLHGVARNKQAEESRSWSFLCPGSSPDVRQAQARFPALFTTLTRTASSGKRCERVLKLSDKDLARCVFCASSLASGRQSDVVREEASYSKFVDYAIEQCSQRMRLEPFPMKNEFREMVSKDGKSVTCSFGFQSEKIRMFRAAEINGGSSVNNIQVLSLVIFPRAAYDLPLFCADAVTFATKHLILLDLNPVFSSLDLPRQYKEKYINPLYPLWKRYNQVLPWGGEISGEAIEFFSPFVIWSRPNKEQGIEYAMFEAFKDYLHVWLDMVDKAEAIEHVDEIQELQHRYMLWRKTKDPGRNLLTGLYGEALCEANHFEMQLLCSRSGISFRRQGNSMDLYDGFQSLQHHPCSHMRINSPETNFDRRLFDNKEYMKEFLFAQLDTLGTKSFLDYFPQFEDGKGSITKKRSLTGKTYPIRPWDENGNFIVRASN